MFILDEVIFGLSLLIFSLPFVLKSNVHLCSDGNLHFAQYELSHLQTKGINPIFLLQKSHFFFLISNILFLIFF